MRVQASPEDIAVRDAVMSAVLAAIRAGEVIRLPSPGEVSRFAGSVGEFRYRFEGEEDLLHLSIERDDGGVCSPESGLGVAHFLMPDLPAGLTWLKPGEFSQHLYFGHDDLLRAVESAR
ncbi:MAG TPA: hypothetical protein PLL78_03230 [Fimbriimonadaceae bacterium]|nr:hypothetical protein [Fimbriimonadaceae bacterium]HRJ95672.1 hypothetical protein [Fimbriimonadaceae bacterium]